MRGEIEKDESEERVKGECDMRVRGEIVKDESEER